MNSSLLGQRCALGCKRKLQTKSKLGYWWTWLPLRERSLGSNTRKSWLFRLDDVVISSLITMVPCRHCRLLLFSELSGSLSGNPWIRSEYSTRRFIFPYGKSPRTSNSRILEQRKQSNYLGSWISCWIPPIENLTLSHVIESWLKSKKHAFSYTSVLRTNEGLATFLSLMLLSENRQDILKTKNISHHGLIQFISTSCNSLQICMHYKKEMNTLHSSPHKLVLWQVILLDSNKNWIRQMLSSQPSQHQAHLDPTRRLKYSQILENLKVNLESLKAGGWKWKHDFTLTLMWSIHNHINAVVAVLSQMTGPCALIFAYPCLKKEPTYTWNVLVIEIEAQFCATAKSDWVLEKLWNLKQIEKMWACDFVNLFHRYYQELKISIMHTINILKEIMLPSIWEQIIQDRDQMDNINMYLDSVSEKGQQMELIGFFRRRRSGYSSTNWTNAPWKSIYKIWWKWMLTHFIMDMIWRMNYLMMMKQSPTPHSKKSDSLKIPKIRPLVDVLTVNNLVIISRIVKTFDQMWSV